MWAVSVQLLVSCIILIVSYIDFVLFQLWGRWTSADLEETVKDTSESVLELWFEILFLQTFFFFYEKG